MRKYPSIKNPNSLGRRRDQWSKNRLLETTRRSGHPVKYESMMAWISSGTVGGIQEAGPALFRLSGTTLTVEDSGGTASGIFSDFNGQEKDISLVLEVQELRIVNLKYSITYMRRSKVTESSWSEISKQVVDSSNSTIGVSYINQETPLRHFEPASSGRSATSSSLVFGKLLVKNAFLYT